MCKAKVRRGFSKELSKKFCKVAQVQLRKELFVVSFLLLFYLFFFFLLFLSFDKKLDFSFFSSATTANREKLNVIICIG